MFAEGETELRDLIVQNLESCGFLNKIKAELRAGVFLAFEEEGSLRTKIPLFNKKFDKFVESSEGKLAVSLVREFLEYFNLNFTLSVFDPEIATNTPCSTRLDLCNEMNVKLSDLDGPVICSLLKPNSSFPSKRTNPESAPKQSNTGSYKTLETISEDFPSKEKTKVENNLSELSTYNAENKSSKSNSSNGIPEISDLSKNSIIDKLRNEQLRLESKNKGMETTPSLFDSINEKSNVSIFKNKAVLSSDLDIDPFFDEPVPSEKQSYFAVSKDIGLDLDSLNSAENSLNKSSSNLLFGSENNTNALSSLKNLPTLTEKSKEWMFGREHSKNKTLPSLSLETSENVAEEYNKEASQVKSEAESNEESSDRQLNSEESIEEDIEEDFSAGLDDLLNSSLSLGDDATTDQSVSQVSVVDGVDHIEPVKN